MDKIVSIAELILLLLLSILQLGRWSQKTEDKPSDAVRMAKDALAKVEATAADLRKHKHAWQDYLNTRYTTYDTVYARKREVELELRNIAERQETNCDRLTELEQKLERLSGV
jgi:hypothetical protein